MSFRSFTVLSLCVVIAGCGGSEVKDVAPSNDNVLPTANAPTISETPPTGAPVSRPSVSGAPVSAQDAPGKIEMPSNVDPSLLPSSTDPAAENGPSGKGSKAKGFEMPAIDAGAPPVDAAAAPVVAQRPVLDNAPSSQAASASQTASQTASPARLEAATLDQIINTVTAAEKVTVVDFWSLSCEPCLKEFPGLVALQRELGDQVACYSVNVDYDGRKSKPAETYRQRVQDFLNQSQATFPNFLCETPNESVFESLKFVSIPAVLVYDAEGTLVKTFTDTGASLGFSYEKDIAPLVKSLLKR